MIEQTSESSQAKGEQEVQQVRHRMSYLLTVAVLTTYHTIYFRARGYDFLWPFVHDLCRPPITHKLWWSLCAVLSHLVVAFFSHPVLLRVSKRSLFLRYVS